MKLNLTKKTCKECKSSIDLNTVYIKAPLLVTVNHKVSDTFLNNMFIDDDTNVWHPSKRLSMIETVITTITSYC